MPAKDPHEFSTNQRVAGCFVVVVQWWPPEDFLDVILVAFLAAFLAAFWAAGLDEVDRFRVDDFDDRLDELLEERLVEDDRLRDTHVTCFRGVPVWTSSLWLFDAGGSTWYPRSTIA